MVAGSGNSSPTDREENRPCAVGVPPVGVLEAQATRRGREADVIPPRTISPSRARPSRSSCTTAACTFVPRPGAVRGGRAQESSRPRRCADGAGAGRILAPPCGGRWQQLNGRSPQRLLPASTGRIYGRTSQRTARPAKFGSTTTSAPPECGSRFISMLRSQCFFATSDACWTSPLPVEGRPYSRRAISRVRRRRSSPVRSQRVARSGLLQSRIARASRAGPPYLSRRSPSRSASTSAISRRPTTDRHHARRGELAEEISQRRATQGHFAHQ